MTACEGPRLYLYIFCIVNFNIVISWAGCNIIFDRVCLGWSVRPIRDELPWTRCQISRKWRIFRFQIEMRKRALADRVSTKIELNDIVIYGMHAYKNRFKFLRNNRLKPAETGSIRMFTDDFPSFLYNPLSLQAVSNTIECKFHLKCHRLEEIGNPKIRWRNMTSRYKSKTNKECSQTFCFFLNWISTAACDRCKFLYRFEILDFAKRK